MEKRVKGTEIVERKFIGQWHKGPFKGSLDLVYLKTERSKPFSEVSELLEERGFKVAHESTIQKKEGESKSSSENKSVEPCETNPFHTPQKEEGTATSSLPLVELGLAR